MMIDLYLVPSFIIWPRKFQGQGQWRCMMMKAHNSSFHITWSQCRESISVLDSHWWLPCPEEGPLWGEARGWFNIKMPSYQFRNFHYKDKTVSQLPHLYNGNPILVRQHLYIALAPGNLLSLYSFLLLSFSLLSSSWFVIAVCGSISVREVVKLQRNCKLMWSCQLQW